MNKCLFGNCHVNNNIYIAPMHIALNMFSFLELTDLYNRQRMQLYCNLVNSKTPILNIHFRMIE